MGIVYQLNFRERNKNMGSMLNFTYSFFRILFQVAQAYIRCVFESVMKVNEMSNCIMFSLNSSPSMFNIVRFFFVQCVPTISLHFFMYTMRLMIIQYVILLCVSFEMNSQCVCVCWWFIPRNSIA